MKRLLVLLVLVWGCSGAGMVNGTAYWESGDGATALVMLHGYGDSKETWRETGSFLKRDFRVVAYDLAGFGETGNPADKYSVEVYVAQLEGVVSGLGIKEFVLVGNSMGAQIATAYLEKHEGRKAQGLVLVNPSGGSQPAPAFKKDMGKIFAVLNPLQTRPVEADYRAVVEGTLQQVIYDDKIIHSGIVKRFLKPFLSEAGRKGLAGVLKDFGYSLAGGLETLMERWKKEQSTKIVVLWGERDPWFPSEGIETFKKIAKEMGYENFFYRVIKDAGHVPQMEKPADIASIIFRVFKKNQQ
jgi:abhydrolase domain-containing protein 6